MRLQQVLQQLRHFDIGKVTLLHTFVAKEAKLMNKHSISS